MKGGKVKNVEPILCRVTGVPFYNGSRYTFEEHIGKLDKADPCISVISRFCQIDLHPDRVSNIEMGYIFEELIRRFNEASNEEAGDHFTPREVIRLMVNLLFRQDNDVLTTQGIIKTLYDPACGTRGMLSIAEEYHRELNPDARLPRINDGSLLFLQHMITKMKDAADGERLSRLRENTVFAKLASSKKRKDSKAAQAEIEAGTGQQERIIAALRTLASEGVVKGRLERIFGTSESRCHGSRGT